MRRFAIAASCVLVAAGAYACGDSVFTSTSPDDGDASSASDASTDATSPDAALGEAGSTDGGSGGTNGLLVNPGFEDTSGGGCGPGWVSSNAISILTSVPSSSATPAHGGSYSCLVCSGQADSPASIATAPGELAPFEAGVWSASAWVRSPPTDNTSSNAVEGELEETFYDGGAGAQYAPTLEPTATWTLLYGTVTLDVGGKNMLLLFAGTPPSAGGIGCYLIDDVSLTLTQPP